MTDKQEYTIEDNEFKHEDTTHVMKIRFLAGNRFTIYPDKDKSFVAKIGTAGGAFMGTYPVTTDVGRFIVKSADLKGLAVGDYRLEIWEKFTDNNGNIQTRIFPSPKAFVSFTINKNVEDSVWDLVRDVSFQDIVNTAVVAAGQNLVVTGTETLPAGSQASVVQTFKDGKNELEFKLPQGATGPMAALHLGGVIQGEPGTQPDAKLVKGDDGYTLSFVIPRAKDGDKGQKGDDGHTPVRGVDYWTDADQKAIKDDVAQVVGDAYKKASDDIAKTSNSIHWSNIDLTDGYDPNKWYPVISSKGSYNQLDKVVVKKSLYGGFGSKPAPWGTRGDKYVPCIFDLLVSGNGYGSLPTMAYLFANQWRFADKSPIAFDVLTTDTKYLLWLRGGTDYEVGISLPNTTWKVYADGYTTYIKKSITPSTELPANLDIAKSSMDILLFVDLQKLGG